MKKEVPVGSGMETLFGTRDENLRLLETELHLTLQFRNNSIEINGEPGDVARMETLLADYDALVRDGVTFPNGDLKGYLKIFIEDPSASLRELVTSSRHRNFGRKAVAPKSLNQRIYLEAIDRHDMVFGIGPAGTGKTYLAVCMAVSYLLNRRANRIVLARPAVEAGERLGFLPGTLQEKVDPFLRPLYDALYDLLEPEKVERLLEKGTIEIAPIAFMRGRTLSDCFVILDEAQNTTAEQMKMFLTRLGFNSKMVITGDITQIDLPDGRRSGLISAMEVVQKVEGVAFTYFDERDVVRHHLVQKIVRAYEAHAQSATQPSAAASPDQNDFKFPGANERPRL